MVGIVICLMASALEYANAQNVPVTWRLNNVRWSDFETRVGAALGTTIQAMPFHGERTTKVLQANPLIYSYVTENVQASPVSTQPMSNVKFTAFWTFNANHVGDTVFAIPAANMPSEFLSRDLRRLGCDPSIPEQAGSSAFGNASCSGYAGEGIRKGSSIGPVYYGIGRVVVLRSCGYLTTEVRMETVTPPSHGENPQPDAIKESGVLASKYSKDMMKLLLDAFDPVCSAAGAGGLPRPTSTPTPTPGRVPDGDQGGRLNMRKLHLYYNDQHHDSLTIASDDAMRAAASSGYRYISEAGGFVFIDQPMGTIPLSLWYNSSIGDYFTSTTTDTAGMARLSYQFVRVEGFIYPSQQPNSVALKTFWAPARSDYFATATSAGETRALNSGYSFVRIEGYLPTASNLNSVGCGLGVRWDETEDGWSGQWTRRGLSNVFDSVWVSPTGQRAAAIMSISVAGDQITIRRDQSGVGTCSYSGQIAADGVSVAGGYTCSWWPNGGTNHWRAVIRCN